mgnify:CR=1 FL=1
MKVTGGRELRRTLRTLAQEFPKEAARALNTTARKSVSKVRKRVARQMKIKQKVLRERVRWRGAKAGRLVADVWFGTNAGVAAREAPTSRRKSKRRSVADVLASAKTYVATMGDGEKIEYVRTRNYARPAMEQETQALMRDVFPKELKRLIGVTIQRHARRKR